MSKSNFINVSLGVVVGLIFGALDLAQCKIAYANFFDSLEEIITGGASVVISARTTYNTCAQNADSYTALITCAVTAYETYELHLRNRFPACGLAVIDSFNGFAAALQPLTDNAGLPAAQRGIPIPRYRALVDDALSRRGTAPERRRGG